MNPKSKKNLISAIALGNVAAIERTTREPKIELWRIAGDTYTESATGRQLTEDQFNRYSEEIEAATGTLLLLSGDIGKYITHINN